MSKRVDYRQFKFRSINKRLLEGLVNSQLYFAKPETLNDPFDCHIDLQRAVDRAVRVAPPAQKKWLMRVFGDDSISELKRTFSKLGVCSLSMEQANTLMWSHYADEHRGVCLTYSFSEAFLQEPTTNLVGIAKVRYDENSFTNWLAKTVPRSGSDYLQELGKAYLTAKSPAWSYEKEVRVILNSAGLLDLPPGALEQICFGLRTPEEDIHLVMKLAREHAGCKKFGRMVRDPRSDFGLTAVPI